MAISWKNLARKYERELDLESLDSVQNLVSPAVANRKRNIQKEYGELSHDQFESEHDFEMYKDSIAEDYAEAQCVAQVLGEMLITALYKLVEVKRKSLFSRYVQDINPRNLAYIGYVVSNCSFDITSLTAYDNIEELRLLNNCIKHNDSKVSPELVTSNSSYTEGEDLVFSEVQIQDFKQYAKTYIQEMADNFHRIEDRNA